MGFIATNPPSVIVTMWCGLRLSPRFLGCSCGGGGPGAWEMRGDSAGRGRPVHQEAQALRNRPAYKHGK